MADRAPLLFDTRLGGLIDYEPATGALTWRARTPDMFRTGGQTAEHNCAIWNGKFAGRPALNAPDKRGYLTGHLHSRSVKAHRVIWALVYGGWPEGEIDHINGDPSDNRLSNLRLVSHAVNGRNLRLKRNNTTGHCGVYQRPSGRWTARLTVNGVAMNLGTFDTRDEAIAARAAASQQAGFHANHGIAR